MGGRHPILVAAAGDLAATVAVFAASAAFNNSSLYDPYWSLAPLPIAFFWLSQAPPGAGPAAITLLFLLVSVPMMERHLLARHPGYAGLRRGRSAFVPWFRRSGRRG